MKSHRLICLTFAAMTIAGTMTQTASAQIPFQSFYGFQDQFDLGFNRYSANARVLPYFALYPPVYYSQSVPRPYGYSPFALPPGVKPVEQVAAPKAQAAMIINPHFRPSDEQKGKEAADEVAQKSKMILNPFVPQPAAPTNEQLAKVLKARAIAQKE